MPLVVAYVNTDADVKAEADYCYTSSNAVKIVRSIPEGKVIAAAGSVDAVRAYWESSFATMQPFVGSILDADVAARIEELARRYLDGRGPLFATRIARSKVRDGHGDVLADVTFLAMDLERSGAADLGVRFLAWYREFAAETYPETLAQHYTAYRAHVRSKVACLRASQGDAAAREQAGQLLQMTHDHLTRGRVALALVGGLRAPASRPSRAASPTGSGGSLRRAHDCGDLPRPP